MALHQWLVETLEARAELGRPRRHKHLQAPGSRNITYNLKSRIVFSV
jgi:hypothetical protein